MAGPAQGEVRQEQAARGAPEVASGHGEGDAVKGGAELLGEGA